MLDAAIERFFRHRFEKTLPDMRESKRKIKELSERIEQSMADYDALLNGIDTMVWITYDPEFQGKGNKAFLKFFDMKEKDVLGRHLTELMSPEEAEKCIQINREIFKTGKKIVTYEWVTRYDGKKRLLKITKNLHKNNPPYIVASADDITDLEEARNNLETEWLFSNSVIDAAKALIVVLDVEANIVRCNEYFQNITGYKFDEINGLNWFDVFIRESDLERVKAIFASHLETEFKDASGVINPIKKKDGSIILVEWFSKPLMNNNQITIGLVGVGQDVSEHKAIEEELWMKVIDLETKLKKAQTKENIDCVAQEDRNYRGNGEVVLLVEDEKKLLKMFTQFLTSNGYRTVTATCILDAEKILKTNQQVDFILTDFYLQDKTGADLVTYAQEVRLRIPYLVVSGLNPQNFITIPSFNFLQKPFTLTKLLKKIYTILTKEISE